MDKWLIQNPSVGKYKAKCHLKLPGINFGLINKHYIDPAKACPLGNVKESFASKPNSE